MENIYLVVSTRNTYNLHSLIYDDNTFSYCLFDFNKNMVRNKEFSRDLEEAKKELEESFDYYKKYGIIKEWYRIKPITFDGEKDEITI